jgi:hypothetical protein
MQKLGWRLPAQSARAVIAAAGLVVVALIIATYGNAQARSDGGMDDEHHYNPLTQPGWDAAHRSADDHIHPLDKTQ